jgi:hypothetical protein
MKNAIKMLILVAGLACAFEAVAAPIVTVPHDGAPPALCRYGPCPD